MVQGRVIDQEGSPIASALVELSRTRESKRTSPDGRFSFRGVAAGSDTLRIRALGHRIRLLPIVVSESGWNGDIAVERIPQTLPEVGVRGRTVVWKPSEYDYTAKYDDSVSSFLNPYGAPEVRFRLARCPGTPPNLAIYIDGHRLASFGNKGSELSGLFLRQPPRSTCDECSRMAEVLSSIRLSEIEFIEFYRGPGQIPAELERGDACAALVIWRK
jgi:hypothetical protein